MITDLGVIIIDRIQDLPFMDKYAGIVRVLNYKDFSKDGSSFTRKTFPVDCQTSFDECNKNKRYLDLCPDSSKKSVIYLEDNGIKPVRSEGPWVYWTASIDLVAWLNLPKLGTDSCSYSSIVQQGLLSKLLVSGLNVDNYNMINIDLANIKPKSVNPFVKYSYDETINQFLMYPYDYFVMGLEFNFRMNKKCFKVEPLNTPIDCVIK